MAYLYEVSWDAGKITLHAKDESEAKKIAAEYFLSVDSLKPRLVDSPLIMERITVVRGTGDIE